MNNESLTDTVETYDRHAAEYVDRHGDRSVIADLVEAFCASVPDRRVLDVGCGPGWETETFDDRGYDAVGVDLTQTFLDRAQRRHEGRYLRGDMRRLPVATGSVDGVWALASLLHLPRDDVDDALSEFARVCRPGGTLFCAVKHGDGTVRGSTYDDDSRHFTLYGESELNERLAAAGFTVTDSEPDVETDPRETGWVRTFARRSDET